MNWYRVPCPDTRWPLADTISRLGNRRGFREWAHRQASYWWRRLRYTYWRANEGETIYFDRRKRK